MKLREVYERIDALYPKKLSDDYVAQYGGRDNSGILIDPGKEISGAVFSLDFSMGAIGFAKAFLPLYGLGLGWVCPAAAGLALAMALRWMRSKKAAP